MTKNTLKIKDDNKVLKNKDVEIKDIRKLLKNPEPNSTYFIKIDGYLINLEWENGIYQITNCNYVNEAYINYNDGLIN